MAHYSPFKKFIPGFRGGGRVCPCCRSIRDKRKTRRTARRKQRHEDDALFDDLTSPTDAIDSNERT